MSTIRRSAIWNVFTETHKSDFIATCNLCSQEFSYRSTTTNLMKHLQRKHPGVDINSPMQEQKTDTLPKEVEIVIERQLENACEVKSFKVEVQPVPEDCNYIVLDAAKPVPQLWDYFTKISPSDCIASCIVCHEEFSYKTTTWNLKNHLDRNHPELQADVSVEQDQVYQESNEELDQNKNIDGNKEDKGQYQNQTEQVLLDETKVFQNIDNDANDQNQQVDSNDDLHNDFWNLDQSDDDDPDFRPSPTFDEEADVKNISSNKKRSQIWNVFTEKPNSDSVAICNVCNQEFCYRSTTNNLKKHFQRKHPNVTFDIKIEPVKEENNSSFDSTLRTVKSEGDEDDRDSSDGNTKRKRSQIWKYFTRKKPGEYIATCNICKKELGFRSTTSNLKKHLDRKHPNVKMKNEDDEEKKNTPEVRVKTCLVCLQNDQTEPREFLQINNTNSEEEKSYMTKIQEIMNQSVVIDESHVICLPCVDDLEKVIQFKEKVSKAFEFWSKLELEPEPETDDNDADNVNHSDYSDLEEGETLAKFTCSKCNKVFHSPSVMLKHNCSQQSKREKSSMKKETSQETFYCEFCGKAFNIRWKLNKHLKICQSNSSKQFGCNLCNRIFKKAYHLREHMASHTGERNYSCNLCGKTFQRSSSKHKHMRSHNAKPGEKSKKTPFLCTICGKSFPYSNGASRHMRVHLGERRHQCHICMKKFSQTTHLKVHLRTHSGERPYGCIICGRTFSLNASLRKHMRLHVGSGDFVKLVKNLDTSFPSTDMVTEDGLQILTAVAHAPQEIDIDGNQCIG
ncbi:zinc finger protein 23-like [Diorhabda sublineata]|uniref:zinc finger protein 23-like n=1 Tax=Diorhabda sublineata TaxID=1163346 RepID=UPI0024E0E272|nr:zinc finger protein 23-like [Diorhabda sublineata]